MKITIRKYWLFAAVVWCIIIFMFSNQPAKVSLTQSSSIKNIINDILSNLSNNKYVVTDFLIRKAAHFIEYLMLGVLFSLSFIPDKGRTRLIASSSFFCFFLAFIYSCTDEYHQSFISGRAMSFTDIIIDSSGALIGTIIIFVILYFRSKNKIKEI